MPKFLVRWEIELEADTHQDAAWYALRLHRNPRSDQTFFRVTKLGPGGGRPLMCDGNLIIGETHEGP